MTGFLILLTRPRPRAYLPNTNNLSHVSPFKEDSKSLVFSTIWKVLAMTHL